MSAHGSGRRRVLVVGGAAAVVVVALAAFGAWWFFFRDDSPPAVSIESAVSALDEESGAGEVTATATPGPTAVPEADADDESSPASSATPAPAPTDAAADADRSLDGAWVVDTTIGSFDDFSSSFVGYRVQEELASIGGTTAVGRTPAVTGSLELEGQMVTTVVVEADLTQLTSDDSRRDGQMRTQALETNTFPTATFTLTEPIDLGAIPAEGEPVRVDAAGDLDVHGVTRSVTIPLEAQLVGDVIVVTGSIRVEFADHDIDPPSSFAVLSVEDHAEVEMQLFFTRG